MSLIENYDMRQFYQAGIPGHILFGEVLASLLDRYLPGFAGCLKRQGITYSDFFESDGGSWISRLYAGIIPSEIMD